MKKKDKKQPSEQDEEKLKIKGSFEDVIAASVKNIEVKKDAPKKKGKK